MTDRRDFMKLAALGGGAIFFSGLTGCAQAPSNKSASASGYDDFFFVHLSDSHWGYKGPDNPDSATP